MAIDDTTVAEPQAGDAATPQPQAGTTAPPPEPQAGDGKDTISLEEARKLRRENQTLRQRQKAIDEAEEQAKLAALSDVDKANKRAEALEQQVAQYKDQLVQARVEIAAHKLGIRDPEIAALAIKGKLEAGEDGMPSNIEKALTDLLKNKPYLKEDQPAATPAPDATQPAQTSPARPATPALPAMQPGRSSIAQPGTLTPGQVIRITDPGLFKRP